MVSRLIISALAALATANTIHKIDEERQARRHVRGISHIARTVMTPQEPRNAPIEGPAKVKIRYASAGVSTYKRTRDNTPRDSSGSVASDTETSKDRSSDEGKEDSKDKKERDTGSSEVDSFANNGTAPEGGGSGGGLQKTFPTPAGKENLPEARRVTGSFDGGMKLFDRVPSTCTGGEGGQRAAAFILSDGATLSNVIIGGGAGEGVQCQGSCNLVNVSAKTAPPSASDKLFQHNGGGTLEVSDFLAVNVGQVWRSCGNCDKQTARAAVFTNIRVEGGGTVAHYNGNLGDTVKVDGACVLGGAEVCRNSVGVAGGGQASFAPNDPTLCVETGVRTSGC